MKDVTFSSLRLPKKLEWATVPPKRSSPNLETILKTTSYPIKKKKKSQTEFNAFVSLSEKNAPAIENQTPSHWFQQWEVATRDTLNSAFAQMENDLKILDVFLKKIMRICTCFWWYLDILKGSWWQKENLKFSPKIEW